MNKIALCFLLLITPISSTFAYDLYEFVEKFEPSQGLIVEKVFGDEAKSIFESTFYREDRDALYDVLYNVKADQTYTVQAYQYVVKEGEILCESEHTISYEILVSARPLLYYKAKNFGTHALCLPVGKEELVINESLGDYILPDFYKPQVYEDGLQRVMRYSSLDKTLSIIYKSDERFAGFRYKLDDSYNFIKFSYLLMSESSKDEFSRTVHFIPVRYYQGPTTVEGPRE